MERITDIEQQVRFDFITQEGGISWSNIVFNNEVIGVLRERQTSILNPVTEAYQRLALEQDKDLFDGWYESEDEGYIFGYFDTIDKFVDYYNTKVVKAD